MVSRYILLGMGCWLVGMVVYARYFEPLRNGYCKNMESVHGKIVYDNDSSTFSSFIFPIIFAPIFEEFIFRGPILLLIQYNQVMWSLIVSLILGAIFGIAHKYESLGYYNDGTKSYYCNTDLLSIAFGGLSYGLITIIGTSLWPAIIAHGLWNGGVFLENNNPKYSRFIHKCNMLLQR